MPNFLIPTKANETLSMAELKDTLENVLAKYSDNMEHDDLVSLRDAYRKLKDITDERKTDSR